MTYDQRPSCASSSEVPCTPPRKFVARAGELPPSQSEGDVALLPLVEGARALGDEVLSVGQLPLDAREDSDEAEVVTFAPP